MTCKHCGTEIKEGWKVCPSCGSQILPGAEDTGEEYREYRLRGMRRTGRFSFQEILTDIKVEEGCVHVITQGARKAEYQFRKQEVQSIDLPLLPIWKIADILRLLVFGTLAVFTYGLGIFAVLFGIKIMVSRHVRIKLISGQTVKIPICQKADASEFLREFQYSLSEIEKNNAGRIDDKKWAQREWLTSAALLAVAAAAITLGVTLKTENMKNTGTEDAVGENAETFSETEDIASNEETEGQELQEEPESMTIEEYISHCEKITGEELARNPEAYIGKDILLEGKFNILSDSIVIDWFADSGIIRVDYDGKAIDTQGNAVGNVMSGDYGYVAGRYGGEDEWGTRYIDAEIIILDNGMEEDAEVNVSEVQDYIFPDSNSRYLLEEEVRNMEADKLRIARNEIFARHGYMFNDEELQQYFNSTSWYTGTVPAEQFNMDEELNDYEKQNAELIGKVEELNGTGQESFVGLQGVYLPAGYYTKGATPRIEILEIGKDTLTFTLGALDGPKGIVSGEAKIVNSNTAQSGDEGFLITFTWSDAENLYVTHQGELTGMDSGFIMPATDSLGYVWALEFNE